MRHRREQSIVVGIGVETTNENMAAAAAIPTLWQQFFCENIAPTIPNKVSDEMYAVYCRYQNRDALTLKYTMILGCAVTAVGTLPKGFDSIVIPASDYAITPVEVASPEAAGMKVGGAWQEIWQDQALDQRRNWQADFEYYQADGSVGICIGVDG